MTIFFWKKKKRNSTGQDLERHSWDPGFDRIIVWDSGKLNGMRENAKFPNGTGFDCYSVSWIRHNLGTGCGIGEVKGLRDRNDRTSGCGTVVKMERQFGIRTPV